MRIKAAEEGKQSAFGLSEAEESKMVTTKTEPERGGAKLSLIGGEGRLCKREKAEWGTRLPKKVTREQEKPSRKKGGRERKGGDIEGEKGRGGRWLIYSSENKSLNAG